MWDLIVSVPDHCLSFYFVKCEKKIVYLKDKIKIWYLGGQMHYLAYSITKLCQCRKQWYEGWEGIPMYDCSGKEGVFIVVIECGCLSVCQSVDVSGPPTIWCEIIVGWDCDKVIGDLVQHDKATVDASLISVIAVYGNKEEQPHRGNMWASIIHTRLVTKLEADFRECKQPSRKT